VDSDAYNSTSIAADVRDLRRGLGYERWNLFGISYGTPLARAVMRLDPEATRSAILAIGPGPIATDLLRMDIPFFARALERVFRGCAAEPPCHEAFPDLKEEFYQIHASLKEEPMTVQVDSGQFRRDTFTVNSQDYILMIYRLLGSEAQVAHLPSVIRAFGERDPEVVRRLVERDYGGLSSSFSVGMANSVMCYDAHTPRSWNERREAAAPYPPALAEIKYFLLPCNDWSTQRATEDERTPFRSTIPTLVVCFAGWQHLRPDRRINQVAVSLQSAGAPTLQVSNALQQPPGLGCRGR
jgi:pimeloyl-ACP methyl ester carboxylesterase